MSAKMRISMSILESRQTCVLVGITCFKTKSPHLLSKGLELWVSTVTAEWIHIQTCYEPQIHILGFWNILGSELEGFGNPNFLQKYIPLPSEKVFGPQIKSVWSHTDRRNNPQDWIDQSLVSPKTLSASFVPKRIIKTICVDLLRPIWNRYESDGIIAATWRIIPLSA